MIKYMNKEGKQEVLRLYNQISKEKNKKLVDVYKKGDSKVFGAYRGITIRSTMEKIYPRILESKVREQ